MWNINDVKTEGRLAFKANYWQCVLVGFILTLLGGGTLYGTSRSTTQQVDVNVTSSGFDTLSTQEQSLIAGLVVGFLSLTFIISILIKIFLTNPVNVGSARFFQKNLSDPTTKFDTILEGFGDYGRTFLTLLLSDLYVFLWSLLLIIPGVMKAYSYMLVPYIVKDEPQLSSSEVLARSQQMMAGNRWQAFVLDLSFIGWYIFGALTAGIGFAFWTTPYLNSAHAALYRQLKQQY